MKKKFTVIGMGHFGSQLAIDLAHEGAEVVAIDRDESKLEHLKNQVTFPVSCNTTDPNALKSVGIQEMDAVIVGIGEEFESSLMTISRLQELGVKRIIARVISPIHERILRLMNIQELILPEEESARRLAKTLMIEGLLSTFKISGDFSIIETAAPEWIVGKTMASIQLRETHQLNLVTIKKKSAQKFLFSFNRVERSEVLGVIDRDYVFETEDILVIFGDEKHIKTFLEK